jgi:putative chitinase
MFEFFSNVFKTIVKGSNTMSDNVTTQAVTQNAAPNFITYAQLQLVLPANTTVDIQEFTDVLNSIPPNYGIDNKDKFTMFLSQTAYESNYFTELTENLNYSPQRLLQVWPKRFNNDNVNQYARNPQALANYVYANRLGNGDPSTGDGWKYRGRGIIQLTGKVNYQSFADAIGKSLDDTVAYCETITGAVESACWFWHNKKLDQYSTANDVAQCTQIINGGILGLRDRTELYNKVATILAR